MADLLDNCLGRAQPITPPHFIQVPNSAQAGSTSTAVAAQYAELINALQGGKVHDSVNSELADSGRIAASRANSVDTISGGSNHQGEERISRQSEEARMVAFYEACGSDCSGQLTTSARP